MSPLMNPRFPSSIRFSPFYFSLRFCSCFWVSFCFLENPVLPWLLFLLFLVQQRLPLKLLCLIVKKPSSPYFLHNRDNPGSILVTQPLIEDNYAIWSRSVLYALDPKDKTEFNDGNITAPAITSDPFFPILKRCNRMVLSWILNSMSKDLLSSVIYLNTAREVWINLKNRFSQGNGPRVFELRRMVSNLSQENLILSSYYTKFKII